MKLKTLRPRLATLNTQRIPTLAGRPNATPRQRGRAWMERRAAWLRQHPLCCYCEREGRLSPATVVDHIIPHRGDERLFWDRTNWQSLCASCHSSTKAREEAAERRGEGM